MPETPDLDWSFPPATGPIEDDHHRALMERTGLFLGLLGASLSGQANKVLGVRADQLGLEFRAAPLGVVRSVVTITGDVTLGEEHAAFALDASANIAARVCVVKHATPSSPVIVTVPANAAPGAAWLLLQDPGQTGVVTLRPASGVTLEQQTADVTMDGPGAMVSITCFRNTGGSAAEVAVKGEASLGQRLSGVSYLDEVQGAYPSLGAAISGAVTLGAADRGTERRITASSATTITVPAAFRGSVRLRNVSAVAHTIALTGVGNRTLPAGALGLVDGNGTDLALFVATPAAS